MTSTDVAYAKTAHPPNVLSQETEGSSCELRSDRGVQNAATIRYFTRLAAASRTNACRCSRGREGWKIGNA